MISIHFNTVILLKEYFFKNIMFRFFFLKFLQLFGIFSCNYYLFYCQSEEFPEFENMLLIRMNKFLEFFMEFLNK